VGLRIANLVRAARGSRPPGKRSARFKTLRPVRPSKRTEIWYRGQLLGLVAHLRRLITERFQGLRDEWPARTGDAAVVGDREPDVGTFADPNFEGAPRIQMVIEGVKRDMPGLLEFASKTSVSAATKNLAKIDDDLAYVIEQQLGVDVGPILEGFGPLSQQMRKAVQDNIELIRSIPTEYLDRVKETLSTAWQEGVGFEQAGKMLERDFATTESRAALIARDQTQKMAGQFNRERQQQVGIDKYQWRCTRKNTRPEHLAMETGGEGGKGIYRWDEPGPLKGTIDGEPCHPGIDVNCHCLAVPFVDLSDGNEDFWASMRAAQEAA